MPDKITRERLKRKALERWENEGGKPEPPPKGTPEQKSTRGKESEANRSSKSRKKTPNKDKRSPI
jgi:hypothetical protein